MASSNRADRFDHFYKALRKHYKPIVDASDRRVLDYLLYACCLEDSSYEAADEAFAKLQQTYFDANEIRVTTVAELSESLTSLPKASSAAGRLKKSLQSLFEARYSFDIDDLKKANLGKAVEEVSSWDGTSKFVMAYVTQHAFGGHSIPVDNQVLSVCIALELLTAAEASKGVLPGVERAIPKNKGLEFASLLHQFAVEYATDFHHPIVNSVFKEMGVSNKTRVSFVAPIPVKESEKTPLAGTAQHLEATNAKAKADKQAAAVEAAASQAPKSASKSGGKHAETSATSGKPLKMASPSPALKNTTPKEAASKAKAAAAAKQGKVESKTDAKAIVKPPKKEVSKPTPPVLKSELSSKSSGSKASSPKPTPPKEPLKKGTSTQNEVAKAKGNKSSASPKSASSKSESSTSAGSKSAKTSPQKSLSKAGKPQKAAEAPKPAASVSKKGTTTKQLPVKAVTKKNTKPR